MGIDSFDLPALVDLCFQTEMRIADYEIKKVVHRVGGSATFHLWSGSMVTYYALHPTDRDKAEVMTDSESARENCRLLLIKKIESIKKQRSLIEGIGYYGKNPV